jgi:hypothetical protein
MYYSPADDNSPVSDSIFRQPPEPTAVNHEHPRVSPKRSSHPRTPQPTSLPLTISILSIDVIDLGDFDVPGCAAGFPSIFCVSLSIAGMQVMDRFLVHIVLS